MANTITLPYSTTLTTFGSTFSSTYTWYQQWYTYPTITDTMTSQAQITINSMSTTDRNTKYKLPSGYTQLEYIESTGSEWIDTGFAVTSTNYNKLKYVADMESLGSTVASSRSITANNIGEFFKVTNGQYFFAGSGSTFTTNNLGVASSTATTTLTALYDMSSLSFSYSYSSESSYDTLTITVNGTTVANALSGVGSSSYSGSIKAGQTIVFTYSKDSSANSNDDICTFSSMTISTKHDAWAIDGVMVDGNRTYIGSYAGLIYYGNGSANVNTSKSYDFIRHKFVLDTLNGMVNVDNLYSATYTPVAPTLSLNFFMFAYNRSGSAYKGIIRHWGSEIYEDNVLVRKFVPCREESTGSIGMYDLVTNDFFGNSGSGGFLYKELNTSYVDVNFTIYSKNNITRTGTSGYTCTTFTFESQPTIKVNNVALGESVELYDAELTTTVADNGAGTAVSGTITHSATIDVQIPRSWFAKENSEWNFSISDALMIMNTSASATNTYTFASFNVEPLLNVYVCKELKLPEGYTLLKYIESTGTQYIDTGFKPNNNTRVVMDAQMLDITTARFYFGARTSTYTVNCNVLISSSTIRSDYGESKINVTGVSATDRVLIDKNKNICIVNNSTITNTSSTFQGAYNLYLFASNEGGKAGYYGVLKLYSCKIYDNDILIRDYLPCINPDGVSGLYDVVNNVFYTDSAGGSFIANIESYTPIEFIESVDNQYIDTGIIPKVGKTRVVFNNFSILNLLSEWETFFGSDSDDGASDSFRFRRYSSNEILGANWGNASGTYYSNYIYEYTAWSTLETVEYGCNGLIVNSNLAIASETTSPVDGTYSIYLFATNKAGSVFRPSAIKFSSCQMYEGNILVRDYIPVIDANNVVCLYDQVTKTFYYNQGTGTFNAGAVIGDTVQIKEQTSVLKKAKKIIAKKNGILYEISDLKVKVGGNIA